MPLALDLGPSKAKLARAREHAKTLQAETAEGIAQQATHAVRFSPVDPQTGWCEIAMVPQPIDKPRLPVLLGDVVHNLRCALDYLIPPLVEASNAKLSTRHVFPIFLDASAYAAKVGTKTKASAHGPLRHVLHGLATVADWQPYNTKGNPEADPLWGIYRFSNADKHRQLVPFGVVPVGQLQFAYNGVVVEEDWIEEITSWTLNDEIPVGRVRFDPPRAYKLRAVGRVAVDVQFVAPRFGKEDELWLKLDAVPGIVKYVAGVIDSFKLL